MAANLRCHYEVLEVEQTATDDELKKSFRKLALKVRNSNGEYTDVNLEYRLFHVPCPSLDACVHTTR